MPQRDTDTNSGLLGITERISRNESSLADLERRMVNLEDKSDSISRLMVSFEYLTENTKSESSKLSDLVVLQAKQSERITETLNRIDNSLTILNNGQSQIKKEAEEDRARIKTLEDEAKGKDKNVVKRVVDFVVAVALAYVLIQFGLK